MLVVIPNLNLRLCKCQKKSNFSKNMSVNVEKCNLNKSPKCPHGPTILFSRNVPPKRKFYACSACRDRKDCNFFLWKDQLENVNESTLNAWENERRRFIKGINRIRKVSVLKKVKKLVENERCYCILCDRFVLPKFIEKHSEHKLIKGVSDDLLKNPSRLLMPLDNNKKEAQYLFSSSTVKTIINILKNLNIKNVLCVASPRIHESVSSEHFNFNSLLLDLDRRFHNFYDTDQFCWYNMFNHHFFFQKSKIVFNQFLKNNSGNFLLIVDPPFGGRIELLSKTFKRINKQYKKIKDTEEDLKILFIFPCFMEPQILNSLPHFKMLDYKVDYDNHTLFRDGPKGRKHGSPVRIFTNIDLGLIPLPKDEGYKYCSNCNKWVSSENKHCFKCNSCTSKDGRTYVHCEICKRCVKPTWKHCNICNRCSQPDHYCGNLIFEKKCFHCQKEGHKKRECPEVDHESLQRKRRK